MPSKVLKNSNRKVVHEGQYLRFIRNGDWEYVERSNCSAIVIIVPVTKDRHVIFVEQYRPPVGRKVIEFPAGLVNDLRLRSRESIAAAARRELLEETGYRTSSMVKVMEGPVSSGSSGDLVTIFLAKGVEKVSEGGGDDTESIEVHKVHIDQTEQWLGKMKRKGCLIEPKIYAGLYFINSYNKKLQDD